MKLSSLQSFQGKVKIKLDEESKQVKSPDFESLKETSLAITQMNQLNNLLSTYERTSPDGDVLTITIKNGSAKKPKYALDLNEAAKRSLLKAVGLISEEDINNLNAENLLDETKEKILQQGKNEPMDFKVLSHAISVVTGLNLIFN